MTDLILARAERLCLLTQIAKRRRNHSRVAHLVHRLNLITARIAAMENGPTG